MQAPKCYQCNSSLNHSQPQLHISFSCNHQVCHMCFIHNTIKSNLSFLSNIKSNTELTSYCKCNNQGSTKLSYESLIEILSSITKTQSEVKCKKHSMQIHVYCEECNDYHCSSCITTTQSNHPLINCKEKCIQHNDDLGLYCKDCKCSICSNCLLEDHLHHKHKLFSVYRDKILEIKDNLKYNSFVNFERYLCNKEDDITSKINSQIEYTSDTLSSLITRLTEMKTNIIIELYNTMRSIGLIFKIIKMTYLIYYKDIDQIQKDAINSYHILKCLSKTNSIISEVNMNFAEPKVMLDKIQMNLDDYLKEEKYSYLISYKRLDNDTIIAKSVKKKEKIECSSTIFGHSWSVQALLFLTNGLLASSSTDTTIKLWDINDNNNLITTLKGHSEAVYSLIQLRNGNLVSSSKDKTIKVWNINGSTYSELYTLKGHSNAVTSLIELKDGRIASGSLDSNIIIWDTQLKKEDIMLSGNKKFVYCIIQLPDKSIASGSYKEIKVWNIELVKEAFVLTGHNEWVYTLAMLKENKLASGSYDKVIKVWNLDKREQEFCLLGHTQAVSSLVYTEDERLISSSWDKTIKIWDLYNKKEEAKLKGHTNEVLCLAVSRENNYLASGSDDTTIKLWEIN